MLGTLVTLAAWVAVAHSSGAGWVQALGALLAGFLGVGLAGPAVFVRRARCRVTAGPADAVAGLPLTLTLAVSTSLEVRPVDPPGSLTFIGAHGQQPVQLVPDHRGVVTECLLEVASAAPFGLLWWTKRIAVPLPRPLHVAPTVGPTDRAALVDADTAGDGARQVDSRVGEPRGVRAYDPGDLRSWVHWPATAHAGTLMVREMEGPAAEPVTVRALLPDDPDEADRAAEQVLGTVAGLLAAGRTVVLVTVELAGPVTQAVSGVAEAGHRLARALPQRGRRGLRR